MAFWNGSVRMLQVGSGIPRHGFARFINGCWDKRHLIKPLKFSSVEKTYLAIYPYVTRGVVFSPLLSGQRATPFHFMISVFLPRSSLASLEFLFHTSARRIF